MMIQALEFFQVYEYAIYFILGFGVIAFSWKFWVSLLQLRKAFFGLERETAQRRLNQSISNLLFIALLATIVFVIVTFVLPGFGEQSLVVNFAESTINETPFAADEVSLAPILATALPTVDLNYEGCVVGLINITSPILGETIRGNVEVTGTVKIEDFGFFKFEYARNNEALWITVLAGRTLVTNEILVESWDTSRLPPGEYVLQLVVSDRSGTEYPPCRVPVIIGAPAP